MVLVDGSLFVTQFYCQNAVAMANFVCIVQFLCTLSLVSIYLLSKYMGHHKELNDYVNELNIEEEQQKLARQQKTLVLGEDIYSIAFRCYHQKSAETMCLERYDMTFAFEGAMFCMSVQLLLCISIAYFIWGDMSVSVYVNVPPAGYIFICRFLSAYLMHITLEP